MISTNKIIKELCNRFRQDKELQKTELAKDGYFAGAQRIKGDGIKYAISKTENGYLTGEMIAGIEPLYKREEKVSALSKVSRKDANS